MRIRSVKPEYWTDRITGRWPPDVKLLYIGLWNVSDDQGRFEWDLDLLRARLDPFGVFPRLQGALADLEGTGRVQKYEVDGQVYGLIPTFERHQKPQRPTVSRLPPPPEGAKALKAVK